MLGCEIQDYQRSLAHGTLRPLPQQNQKGYENVVGSLSKTIGSLMAHLLSSADKVSNYT